MSVETVGEDGETTPKATPHEFPVPIVHGVGASFNYDETGVYDAVRELWYEAVGSPEAEGDDGERVGTVELPSMPGGPYVVLLSSSRWKAGEGEGDDYTAWYKYHLTLREERDGRLRKPPVSLSLTVVPQVEGLVYRDGSEVSLPYGEGTKIGVQTTYVDGAYQPVFRTDELLTGLLDESPGTWTGESARLTKCEAHARFHRERKNAVVESIDRSKGLIAWGGNAEVDAWQRRKSAGWLESRLRSDRWDLLGFDPVEYTTQLKCYQTGDWPDRSPDDPLHHPKLEAEYQRGDADAHPPLDEFDRVVDELREKVVQQARWAGVDRGDLIADEFFDGSDAPIGEFVDRQGRREDLESRYDDLELPTLREVTKERTKAPYDILAVLLEEAGATYGRLEDETGLSRRSLRRHAGRLEDLGLIERIGNPTVVVFAAPYVEETVREVIERVAPDTVARDRLDREDRARERRERRENDGDDDRDTRAAFDYLASLGISPSDLAALVEAGVLDDDDVRVRRKPGVVEGTGVG